MIHSKVGAAGVALEMVHCVRLRVFPVGKEGKKSSMSSERHHIFCVNLCDGGNNMLSMPAHIQRPKKRTHTIDKADYCERPNTSGSSPNMLIACPIRSATLS